MSNELTDERDFAGVHGEDGCEECGLSAANIRDRILTLTADRDDWRTRRDAAVAQCRRLHQDGKTREQWHTDNCGAMAALTALHERVAALADAWSGPESHRQAAWLRERDAADILRALLGNGERKS